MKLVKLGGSVITYKGERRRFRRRVTEALAGELAAFRDLCLVHGGGSYGHPLARAYGLHKGLEASGPQGFAQVHLSMRRLNALVLEILHSRGVPAVSIPAAPLVTVREGRVEDFRGEAFLRHLDLGLVPVTFGDVVPDASRGSAILSGDDLMLHLARLLRPDLAVFVTDVDGVLGPDGSLLTTITSRLPDLPMEEWEADVTGGLKRKLSLMLQMAKEGCRCLLVNGRVPGRLRAALKGEEVLSTEVRWA